MKKRKLIYFDIIFIIIVLVSTCFSACDKNIQSNGEFPVNITDCNNNIVIVDKAVSKIVILSPSLAQICVDLGSNCEVKLTARCDEITDERFSVLESVGSCDSPDMQKIIDLKCDMILTQTPLSEKDLSIANENNIIVLQLGKVVTRESLMNLYNNVAISLLGKNIGSSIATERTNSILLSLDDINRMVPERENIITGCYIYSKVGEKYYTASNENYVGMLLENLGLVNIVQIHDDELQFTSELVRSNPDYIFVAKGLKDTILADESLSQINAVINGKVYELENSMMNIESSKAVDVSVEISQILYPKLNDSVSSTDSNENSSTIDIDDYRKPKTVDKTSSTKDITTLNKRLIELGYLTTKNTAIYSSDTTSAVKDFQQTIGVEKTGIVDETTAILLFANDAPKKTS